MTKVDDTLRKLILTFLLICITPAFAKTIDNISPEEVKTLWMGLKNKKVSFGDKIIIAQNIHNFVTQQAYTEEHFLDYMENIYIIYEKLLVKDHNGKSKLEKMSPFQIKFNHTGSLNNNYEMAFYALSLTVDQNNISQKNNFLIQDIYGYLHSISQEHKHYAPIKQLLKARINILMALSLLKINDSKIIKVNANVQEVLFRPIRAQLLKIEARIIPLDSPKEILNEVNSTLKLILKDLVKYKKYFVFHLTDPHIKKCFASIILSKKIELMDEYQIFLKLMSSIKSEIQ